MNAEILQATLNLEEKISCQNASRIIEQALLFIKNQLSLNLVCIALAEEDRDGFLVYSFGFDSSHPDQGSFYSYNDTILFEVTSQCKAMSRANITPDSIYEADVSRLEKGIRSEYLHPLLVNGICIGVFLAGSTDLEEISGDVRQAIALMAPRLAMALQNQQLYEILYDAQGHLEKKIEMRTIELTQSNTRLQAEVKARKDAEHKALGLSAFAAMNPAPTVKLDRDGRVVLFNRAAEDLFQGVDLYGKLWRELCPESSYNCAVQKSLDSKVLCQHEACVRGKHFLFTCKQLPDGSATYIFSSDITAGKKAEQEIASLSVFPEMNPAPVIKVDSDGQVLLFNQFARKLFEGGDLVGRLWSEVCPESTGYILPQVCREDEVFQHEAMIQGKHYLFTYKRVPGGDQVFIFGADISGRRRAEQMLQKAHDSLETQVVKRTSELVKSKEEVQDALAEVKDLKNLLQAENIYLKEEIQLNSDFEEIIGSSNPIKNVLSKVELVAATDATVLITGETGTGKELFARAIHKISPRNKRSLIKVNCAALQPTLIESELFGHEKGSFTGAFTQRIGRFELANNGAIFLDEIGDLTLELQAKLLRVIQEKEFERLGGSQPIKTNVRLIAATHKDLRGAVRAGNFREDLFYRLNVFPIVVPSLRERKDDIPVLVKHFVRKFSLTLRKEIDNIPRHFLEALQDSPWPGNVRELENIIERAVILTKGNTLQLDQSILTALSSKASSLQASPVTLDELQRVHIVKTLQGTHWRLEGEHGAATLLGVNPSTLRSRMKKFGITRP